MTDPTNPKPKKMMKGFACMTPEARARIASLGGKAGHAQGVAHKYTSETGKAAAAIAVANRNKNHNSNGPVEIAKPDNVSP